MSDIFSAWEQGKVEDEAVLRALWSDLREIEDELTPLQAERDRLRNELAQVIAKIGTVILPGFGRALITNPTQVVNYDKKAMEKIIATLRVTHPDIVADIMAAQRVTMRAGSLRIEKEK